MANILGDSEQRRGREKERQSPSAPLQPRLLVSIIPPLFDILIFKKTRRMPETGCVDRLRLRKQFP